jgi:ribosome biogenesis protein SSF1/2
MNNFTTPPSTSKQPADSPAVPKHVESLARDIFSSLFPPLTPQSTPLSSIKRVLLLNRESPSLPENNAYTITLRHYAINTKATGLPKSLKRLNNAEKNDKGEKRGKGVPNLGKLEDVADYLLAADAGEGNYTSASESEAETDAEVEVLAQSTRKVMSRSQREKIREAQENDKPKAFGDSKRQPGVEKRAIQLKELGPRMRLRLVKVEDGVCGGKIMWHDFVQKSKAEEKEMERKWEERRKAKEERKRIQRENVERKKKEKGLNQGDGDDGDADEDDEEFWDSEDDGMDVEDGANGHEDEDMEDGGG